MVNAEVASGGELSFDGQIVGRLQGFRFTPEPNPDAAGARIDESDIASAIGQEFEVRANRLSEAVDGSLVLANDGAIRWLGDPVAKIAVGDKLLAPRALLLADETLTGVAQQKAQTRVDLWLTAHIRRLLGPLFELEAAVGMEGAARNVAIQLSEALGVLERGRVAHDVKSLDQSARGMLRKLGVRFGAYYIYIPGLVKPAIRVLAAQLWALRQGGADIGASLEEIPQFAASGRTSFLAVGAIPKETYRVAGFRLCGDRAVRVDIVERLADLIRPAVAYRPGPNVGPPPAGAADGDGFVVTGAMTSLTGCSGEQFASVLRSLGFASHRVKGPVLTVVAPNAHSANEQAETIAAPPAAERPSIEIADENDAQPVEDRIPAPPEIIGDAEIAPAGIESEGAAIAVESGLRSAGDPALGQPETAALAETERTGDEAQPVRDAAPDENPAASGEAASPEPAATNSAAVLDGEAPDGPTAPADEVLIEVWRPRPPPGRQRNPRAGSRDHASARPDAANEGDQAVDRRDGVSERMRHRRHRPSRIPAPQTGAADGSPHESRPQSNSEEANRPQRGRGPRRPFDLANKPDGGAGRRGGPNRGAGQEGRKQDERRQENAPVAAPRREAPVNLNSPFAKLLALKSQLEAKGKG